MELNIPISRNSQKFFFLIYGIIRKRCISRENIRELSYLKKAASLWNHIEYTVNNLAFEFLVYLWNVIFITENLQDIGEILCWSKIHHVDDFRRIIPFDIIFYEISMKKNIFMDLNQSVSFHVNRIWKNAEGHLEFQILESIKMKPFEITVNFTSSNKNLIPSEGPNNK